MILFVLGHHRGQGLFLRISYNCTQSNIGDVDPGQRCVLIECFYYSSEKLFRAHNKNRALVSCSIQVYLPPGRCVCVRGWVGWGGGGGGGVHALVCHAGFSETTTATDFLSINCPNEFSRP